MDSAAQAASDEIFGQGEYRYRYVKDWMKLPDGWQLGEAAGVAVDANDNVYVYARGKHPVTVFDRDGNFLRSWGEDVSRRPHGIHVGHDGMVYCTDDTDNTVRKYTTEGKLLMTIGTPGVMAPFLSGLPFCRCCHTALSPSGEIYVADGYGNSRVHKYAPDGRHLLSWGENGTGPSEFNIVHNIACDGDGWVYVCDRENHRIQVFDPNGKLETVWHYLHRPMAIFQQPVQRQPHSFICEVGGEGNVNKRYTNIGPRISVLDHQGKVLSRFGKRGSGEGNGAFVAPHGIAASSRGDIYVAEVIKTGLAKERPGEVMPDNLLSLQKYERVFD